MKSTDNQLSACTLSGIVLSSSQLTLLRIFVERLAQSKPIYPLAFATRDSFPATQQEQEAQQRDIDFLVEMGFIRPILIDNSLMSHAVTQLGYNVFTAKYPIE